MLLVRVHKNRPLSFILERITMGTCPDLNNPCVVMTDNIIDGEMQYPRSAMGKCSAAGGVHDILLVYVYKSGPPNFTVAISTDNTATIPS